ncbi:MAG TPA: universal stress protein [Jatrophihabitans sp.]|jgi:nucleotide-binding universal stress UspA family protein|nr:universal stress protein [Jatrophihabitans sp.]
MSSQNATRRLVVGIDGSPGAAEALRWAARHAELSGLGIDAVIAWQPPVSYGWAYGIDDWRPDADAEKTMTAQIDAIFGTQRPAHLRLLVREGHAAKVLIEASKDAELLVVGSRGHGGFAGLLLGSVSANCAERAHCPVVVVHPSAHAE